MRELPFHMLELFRLVRNPMPHMHRQPPSIERSMYMSHRPVREQHHHPIPMLKLRCQLQDLQWTSSKRLSHLSQRILSSQRIMSLPERLYLQPGSCLHCLHH